MKSKTKKTVSRKSPKRGFAVLDREKARKDAPVAVRALRRIVSKARADLSVSLVTCNRLDYALDLVDEELNELLPPPGSRPETRLPFDDECQPMCPEHPLWDEFLNRLAGPEGCNFQRAVPDDRNSLTWTCDPDEDYPLSRRILTDMGLNSGQIESSLAYFAEYGGCCDCEIVLNVGVCVAALDGGNSASEKSNSELAEPTKAKADAVVTAPLPDIDRWDELTDEEKDALIDHYAKPCED